MTAERFSVGDDHPPLRLRGLACVRVCAWGLIAALMTIYIFSPWWTLLILPAVYWGYLRYMYPFVSSRPKRHLIGIAELGMGVGWGLCVVLLCLSVVGSLRFERASLAQLALIGLFATCEEILWRGMVLAEIELHLGSLWALVLSSTGFALLHLSLGPSLIGQLAAGFAYGSAYLASGRLWSSVGMHAAVNCMLFMAVQRDGTLLPYIVLQMLAAAAMLAVARARGGLKGRSCRRLVPRQAAEAQENTADRGWS